MTAFSCRAVPVLLSALLTLCPSHAWAQGRLQTGSSNAAVAEPPVLRPASVPVIVPLFRDVTFTDYSSHPFAFVPPPGLKRRWAKIVLVGDFFVTAGRQFDRTGEISVGHTNIFFGTTAEPSDGVGPAWHVERDVTDYAALFEKPQPGQTQIGNIVNATYTGVIHGSASLLFYPAGKSQAAPQTPDLVLPLPANGTGGKGIGSPTETLTQTYTLPTNITRVYLDVITQSQGSDEFWYFGVPNSLTKKLQSSGNTAFREAEITVDGVPAGVAPVFPWIYTGGIDPGWWRPIPAVQTLNLKPYRVDLTPFAGLLSNGHPHTVGVRVYNNANFFQVAGALLIYRDPVLQRVRGGLLRNTLTRDPSPVVQAPAEAGGMASGEVSVTSHRHFTIAGYVLTSAGKETTTLTQTADFSSRQQFSTGAKQGIQDVRQISTLSSTVQTQMPNLVVVQQDYLTYPLAITTRRRTNPDGTATQTASVEQGVRASHQTRRNGRVTLFQQISDLVHPSSTRFFDASGKPAGRSHHSSTQTYTETSPRGSYTLTLTAENGILTHITNSRRPAEGGAK